MSAPTAQAIFLSYAREDLDAARRIADALRSHGLEVWFDQNELRGGDVWDQKIRRQIKECALFVPLISVHTQERKEGYFRLEWRLAVERTHLMAEGVPFLTPVVVDGTAESAAIVPAEFLRVQWTRLPGALATPQFVEQIKRLLNPSAAAPVAHVESPAAAAAPVATAKSNFPVAFVAGLAVAVLALVGYIALQPAAKVSAPPVAEAKPAPAAKISSKSIAILPFANMSDDKDTGFFADGVHEDLLTNLALVPELKVISRTSVMQYRGTTKTIKEIGQELGVAYILEGSVRRAGNKVRVTGQLINTRTDEHIWAESYDRDLTDIFSIQAELSKKIAGALSAAISPQTQKFLERRPTENPVAYDDYLKGRDLRNNAPSGVNPALREAEVSFKEAVKLDPNFAAAWGELAIVHALNAFWGADASPERLAQADEAIAQAVRLAPDDPKVIEAIGTYAYYAHRDYARATAQYEKLARLQPNNPTVYSSLGLILRRQGRWAESLEYLRKAVQLDPANVGYTRNLLASLQRARRWDDVRAAHERLIALRPGDLREQLDLANDEFVSTGQWNAVDTLLARLTPEQRDSPVAIFYRKNWAGDRGDYAEFKRLDQLQPTYDEEETSVLSAIRAGIAYLGSGDLAAAKARVAPYLESWRARVQREPANTGAISRVALMDALAGNGNEARQLSRRMVEMMPESRDAVDGPLYLFVDALVHAVLGDKDEALAALEQSFRGASPATTAAIRHNPGFAKLQGDPRFEAILNDPKNNAPRF